MNYGSAGNGSLHLAMEKLAQETGTKMTHVPFPRLSAGDDRAPAQRYQLARLDIPGALEHVQAGKLRALAVTGNARMPQLPDVPTMAEAGVRDYDGVGFLGIMAGGLGTPPEAIEVLNREIDPRSGRLSSRHRRAGGGAVGGGRHARRLRRLPCARQGDLDQGHRHRGIKAELIQ